MPNSIFDQFLYENNSKSLWGPAMPNRYLRFHNRWIKLLLLLIEGLGGSIGVESEQDSGSTFRVLLGGGNGFRGEGPPADVSRSVA